MVHWAVVAQAVAAAMAAYMMMSSPDVVAVARAVLQ